jgi:hypothetical protein
LERVRSCCEFTGYLRLILDGHLRAGDPEEEKEIWDETIRLRERMFWSRIGAGIVPLFKRQNEPETEAPSTDFNNGTSDDDDEQCLEPVDVTYLQPKAAGVPFDNHDNHSAQSDVPRPQSSIYDRDDMSMSDKDLKRISADSDVSVYEEANADVTIDVKEDVSNDSSTPAQSNDTEATATAEPEAEAEPHKPNAAATSWLV